MPIMTIDQSDITGSIGPMFPATGAPIIQMYSFDRPSTILWQGVYDGLVIAGKTHQEAIDWLQSKHPRWALDGDLGDAIRALGYAIGSKEGAA